MTVRQGRLMVYLSFLVSALLQGPLSFSPAALRMYTWFVDSHTWPWGYAPPGLCAEFARRGFFNRADVARDYSKKKMKVEVIFLAFKHTIDQCILYIGSEIGSSVYMSAVEVSVEVIML